MTRYSVIVIDDEPIVVNSLKFQLQRHFGAEMEIETAYSAAEGLELIQHAIQNHEVIPLVICDFLMPGMKGDELIIKLHQQYPDTLSVLLTGQIDVPSMANIVNHAKLFRYIAKPWEETDLVLTVREAVNSFNLHTMVSIQNKQIVDYAFSNAHNVRGPLARILGLVSLMKMQPELITEADLIDKLHVSARELDEVVRAITVMLEDRIGQK